MTLGQLIEGFFLTRRTSLAKTTQQNYRICAAQLAAYLGADREVSSIMPEDLRRFAEHLAGNGLAKRSVADKLTITSVILKFAEGEFGIPNAMRQVERPEWKAREIVPLTEAEVRALVSAAVWSRVWTGRKGKPARTRQPFASRNIAIILVLVDTGIRASELCDLEMRDYNRDEQRLHIRHGKGDKERYVYLGAAAGKALWRYRIEREQSPDAPLFAARGGARLDRTNLAKTLNAIASNAGVSHVHPHRFRHTFAINYLRNGGNVFALQKVLGHERLETVMTYLKYAQTDLATAQRQASPADNWRL